MISISQNQEYNVKARRDTIFAPTEANPTSTAGLADLPMASQAVVREYKGNTNATDAVHAGVVPNSTDYAHAPGAARAVDRVQRTAIAIVTIQLISLVAYGFNFWGQWVISLTGGIMALALLSKPSKFCHSFAAIVFLVGGVFDVIMTLIWIQLALFVDDVSGTLSSNEPDRLFDMVVVLLLARAGVSALAALTMFFGSIFAIIAVVVWDRHEDPDASNSV